MTTRNDSQLHFSNLGNREVIASFDGEHITSDAGGLLLREIEKKFGFIENFAKCFSDYRDPDRIEHSLLDLLKQRIFGLCLGYEDLNDHDFLRMDPLLAIMVGKTDPHGEKRPRQRDRGKALAGKSTLNRLELTPVMANNSSRYKKIVGNLKVMQEFFLEAFIQQNDVPPTQIVLDIDSTDFPLHGEQNCKGFNAYYDCNCYLPLYIFCGDHPILALLRPSNIDNALGVLKNLIRIVTRIRQVWPKVPILIRGDSGFCREHLMAWCEDSDVDYLFGLAKNSRLETFLNQEIKQAKDLYMQTRQPSRVFKDFEYKTLDSWTRERRVVGKAEHTRHGSNPRFVVTSLSAEKYPTQTLYEKVYCARGDMENRIKEQKMLFACRSSCETMRANQLRLNLATVAYLIMRALRQFGLGGTGAPLLTAFLAASAVLVDGGTCLDATETVPEPVLADLSTSEEKLEMLPAPVIVEAGQMPFNKASEELPKSSVLILDPSCLQTGISPEQGNGEQVPFVNETEHLLVAEAVELISEAGFAGTCSMQIINEPLICCKNIEILTMPSEAVLGLDIYLAETYPFRVIDGPVQFTDNIETFPETASLKIEPDFLVSETCVSPPIGVISPSLCLPESLWIGGAIEPVLEKNTFAQNVVQGSEEDLKFLGERASWPFWSQVLPGPAEGAFILVGPDLIDVGSSGEPKVTQMALDGKTKDVFFELGEEVNEVGQLRIVQAQCLTIQLKLLKIGGIVKIRCRRILISLSEAYPFRSWFIQVWTRLHQMSIRPLNFGGTG